MYLFRTAQLVTKMMISEDANTSSVAVMAVEGLSHQVVLKNLGTIGKP